MDDDEILAAIEKLRKESKTMTAELGQIVMAMTTITGLLIELIEPESEEYLPVPQGPGSSMMHN